MKNLLKLRLNGNGKGKASAQSLTEFALILPVLLILIFVLIELARVLHAWLAVENGARMGVRYAVTMQYDPSKCQSGTGADGTCAIASDIPAARTLSIHDATTSGSASIVRVAQGEASPNETMYFNVVVCKPEDLIPPSETFGATTCDSGEDPGDAGGRVVVAVEFNHPLILPFLSSAWPYLRVSAMREAVIETYRVPQVGVPMSDDYVPPEPRPPATKEIPPQRELCPPWQHVPVDESGQRIWQYYHIHSLNFDQEKRPYDMWSNVHAGFPADYNVGQAVLSLIEVHRNDCWVLEEVRIHNGSAVDVTIPVNGEYCAAADVPVNIAYVGDLHPCEGNWVQSLSIDVTFREPIGDGSYTIVAHTTFSNYPGEVCKDYNYHVVGDYDPGGGDDPLPEDPDPPPDDPDPPPDDPDPPPDPPDIPDD